MNYEILSLDTAEKLEKIRREEKETNWNLDYSFIVWLNKHLKEYRKNASKVVDLTFHKIEYKDKIYTQGELIDKLIDVTNDLKENYYDWEKNVEQNVDDMLNIFSKLFYSLWW